MHSVLALEDRNSTLFGDEQSREGGGGGVEFNTICPYVSAILKKKTHRDIFQHKKSRKAKFQPIRSNLENRYEIVIWGRLARSYSINSCVLVHDTGLQPKQDPRSIPWQRNKSHMVQKFSRLFSILHLVALLRLETTSNARGLFWLHALSWCRWFPVCRAPVLQSNCSTTHWMCWATCRRAASPTWCGRFHQLSPRNFLRTTTPPRSVECSLQCMKWVQMIWHPMLCTCQGRHLGDCEAMFTLGARALVPGPRHKMVLCSDTGYPRYKNPL